MSATGRFVALNAAPEELAGRGLWFCVRDGEILVDDAADHGVVEGHGVHELGLSIDVAADDVHFLGTLDGRPCWAADVGQGGDAPAGAAFVALRGIYGRVPEHVWTLAGRALQIVEWHRTHKFCGRCATPTHPVAGERAKRCPACGLMAFPRLAPAIIVLIERGDEILLANGRAFGAPMYSTLAGFVEPGETLEEAVHREVREEVGIEVDDVSYFASQPWPFPHSLMIGFTARWAAGEIVIDENEIVDAGWFTADALPMIPPRMSIARALIDSFLERRPG